MKAWLPIGVLLFLCVLTMSGCAISRVPIALVVPDILLDSVPPGAAVYLMPKIEFELNPSIMEDQEKLAEFRVTEGNTPVVTTAREQVYIVLFFLDGQVEMRELDVLPPPHKNVCKAVFP